MANPVCPGCHSPSSTTHKGLFPIGDCGTPDRRDWLQRAFPGTTPAQAQTDFEQGRTLPCKLAELRLLKALGFCIDSPPPAAAMVDAAGQAEAIARLQRDKASLQAAMKVIQATATAVVNATP